MYHTIIETLIPSKYYTIVQSTEKDIKVNIFEKANLRRNLINNLKKIYKNFLALDNLAIKNDIDLLMNNELLKITEYDKECVNYDLQPLNFKEIYRLLNNLYYEEIYRMFTIVESTLTVAALVLKKVEYSDLLEKVEDIKSIDILFKDVCYGKNLSDLYENRIGWARRDINYLIRYINALV